MTLYGDFLGENHRRVHKWYQYFPAYEAHLERFRNRHVTVFEIGIGEGGSLQQWRRYLGPFATIVGMDIYPRCRQVEEDQVHVRIGSQADVAFLASVVAEFGPPDIVIDDGSHLQHHVNTTFRYLYPLVAKNGVYLVEDLHAAYWPDHGGGLRAPESFIETAKSYVDRMHADYVADASVRSPEGDRTTSIHFYDSMAVLEVGERRVMGNKLTGNQALFSNDWSPPGEDEATFRTNVDRILSNLERPGQQRNPVENTPVGSPQPATSHEVPLQAKLADDQFPFGSEVELRNEIALLRNSTSWRLTAPLRAVGRLFSR